MISHNINVKKGNNNIKTENNNIKNVSVNNRKENVSDNNRKEKLIENFHTNSGTLPRLANNPNVKEMNDANEKRKHGVSATTQAFCKQSQDSIGKLDPKEMEYKGISQRKRIEFKPDKEQSLSEFTEYNPFFLIFPVMNFILQFVGEFFAIFWWLVRESFNAVYDMMIPKNVTGSFGIKPGTKYCINKVYWRYFLTMLCPPAGVFMAYGITGWVQIIICCVLSLLYYIPGLIYALIVMNRSDVAEQIENAKFGSCDGSKQSFFISDQDNKAKCNRVVGDKCHAGEGKPVPNDPTASSCCMQPEYKDGRWYLGTQIALNSEGEEIRSYEEGETMCKVPKFNFFTTKDEAGVCVFKSTGRPSI